MFDADNDGAEVVEYLNDFFKLKSRWEVKGILSPQDLRKFQRLGRRWVNLYKESGDRDYADKIERVIRKVVNACNQGRMSPRKSVRSADRTRETLERGLQ